MGGRGGVSQAKQTSERCGIPDEKARETPRNGMCGWVRRGKVNWQPTDSPPAANSYYVLVLSQEGAVPNPGSQRGNPNPMPYYGPPALGRVAEAADLATQRLRAVALANKKGDYEKGPCIELIPLKSFPSLTTGEMSMIQKEQAWKVKLNNPNPPPPAQPSFSIGFVPSGKGVYVQPPWYQPRTQKRRKGKSLGRQASAPEMQGGLILNHAGGRSVVSMSGEVSERFNAFISTGQAHA